MRKKDFLLILIIVATAFLLWIGIVIFAPKDNDCAVISVNSEIIAVLDIQKDGIYEFEGFYYPFTVEIKNSRVHLINASCPDKVCQHTGYISVGGQSIVCLPNKVIIQLKKKEGLSLDAVL